MGKFKMTLVSIITSILVLIFITGCTPDQVFHAAHIKASFRLRSQTALDGKVHIDEAYLKLHEINVTGNGQGDITNLTHPIPTEEPPYQLSKHDSSQVSFNLLSRNYNQLDFHLILFQDTYELIIKEEIIDGGAPDDGGNDPDDNSGDKDEDDENDNDDGDGDHEEDEDEGENDDEGDEDDEDDNDNDNDDHDQEDEDDDGRLSENKKRTVDIDHFFQNAKPGLLIAGTYQNNGKTLKLIFVLDHFAKLTVRAKPNDSQVILLGEQNIADIVFDPVQWFEAIANSALESADIQIYQGQQVVFIHRDFNTALFDALAGKLEKSTSLHFSEI
ncbi:MAG: hypothetical protein ABIR06_04290 [Cyclobacteriaceae bacterium]